MRKFLIALLSIVCVLFCSLGLIACGEEANNSKEPSGNDPEVVNSIFNEVKSAYLLGENYTFSEDDIKATGKTDSV